MKRIKEVEEREMWYEKWERKERERQREVR